MTDEDFDEAYLLLEDPGTLTAAEASDYQDALENYDAGLDGIEGYKRNGKGTDVLRLKDDLDFDLLQDKINEIGYDYEVLPDENNPQIINTIGTPNIGAFGQGREIHLNPGNNAQEQKFRRMVIGLYLSDKYSGNNNTGSSN